MKTLTQTFLAILIIAFLFSSCTENKKKSKSQSKKLTLSQLDSIGKAFVPEIGKYGGKVTIPLKADPDGFCPATSSSAYAMDIMAYIYEGLITTDPVSLKEIPLIAKSWEKTKDGLIWTFNLRSDVYFTDSVKLSAYDVEFTFNDIIYNEAIRSPLNYNFRIKGKKIIVKAIDSFTVIFTLPDPYAPFLTVAGMSIMPKHLYKKHAKNATLDSYLAAGNDPSRVVGSGPFILEKVELGQRIVLKRNPNYWKKNTAGNKLPYLDGIVMPLIQEPNVQMLKFKNGELDFFALNGSHYPILKPLEKEKDYRVYRVGPRWYDSFFMFNQNNQRNPETKEFYLDSIKQSWFRNINFRKACAYAVNYEAIINIIYNGLAYPPDGIWGKHKGFFHSSNAVNYNYNIKKAKALLKAEGFVDKNGDGFLEDKNGNTVEFVLTTTAGVKQIKDTFEMIRKDLELIGLKVHMNLVEFNNMIDKVSNTFDWDVVAFSLGGITDPHFGKSSVISSSFRYTINPKQAKPFYKWEARIDEIFEVAVSEMDSIKRKDLYCEWQDISTDKVLKVYLPLKEVILAVSNRIGNIHLTKYLNQSESLLWNIEEIFIKE